LFSDRTDADRRPNALSIALERVRAAGREIVDLTLSNPTVAELPYAGEEILAALGDRRALVYEPEPFGLWSAREALTSEWQRRGFEVAPECIALTASTSEAYGAIFKLLCDPGDELIVPAPSYPLLEMLARFENVRLRRYRLAYDGAWHIDFDSLRRAKNERSRAIVLVSPNNPTGSFVKKAELRELEKLGLPLVSDEVFSSFEFRSDPGRAMSALEATGCLVFALGGLSKLAALPQLKLSWTSVSGPEPELTEALERLELVLDAYLSPATPVQLALPRLLELRVVTESAIVERLRDNRVRIERALAGSAATLLDLEGGWYAVVRLPATHGEEHWVLALLERDGVLVQPGYFYDFETEPIIVLSLLTPASDLERSLERLRRRLDSGL
jgi:aspartate/methionine/tyrosine aminotransferase